MAFYNAKQMNQPVCATVILTEHTPLTPECLPIERVGYQE